MTPNTPDVPQDRSKALLMMSLAGAAIGVLPGMLFASDMPDESYWLQFVETCSAAGALTGGFAAIAIQIATRFRTLGKASFPCRSTFLAIVSAMVCVCGFAIMLFGWNQISELATWNAFRDSASQMAVGILAMVAGFVMCCASVMSLCFLDTPSLLRNRCSIVMACVSLGLLALWPVISYAKYSAAAHGSHSDGAGFGAVLIVFVIPALFSIAILGLVGLLTLCRPLTQLHQVARGDDHGARTLA